MPCCVMPCRVVLLHVQAVLLYILDAEGYMDLPIGSVGYDVTGLDSHAVSGRVAVTS